MDLYDVGKLQKFHIGKCLLYTGTSCEINVVLLSESKQNYHDYFRRIL